MTTTVHQVFEEALSLSEESRVALAERLLESVAPAPELMEEQMVIVRQRIAELETGHVLAVSGVEGLNRVRETLLKRSAA